MVTLVTANHKPWIIPLSQISERTGLKMKVLTPTSPPVVDDVIVYYGDIWVVNPRLLNAKKVLVFHDSPLLPHPEVISPADDRFIWFPSSQFDYDMLDFFGYSPERVVWKHNYFPVVRAERERKFDYIYVATQPDRKGTDLVLDVLKMLEESKKELSFYFILNEPWYSRYKEFLSKAKYVRGVVRRAFTLSNEEIVEAYLSSKTLIFPSYVEGIGMPVIEAGNYNVGVITTKGRAMNEWGIGEQINIVDIRLANIENDPFRRAIYYIPSRDELFDALYHEHHPYPVLFRYFVDDFVKVFLDVLGSYL